MPRQPRSGGALPPARAVFCLHRGLRPAGPLIVARGGPMPRSAPAGALATGSRGSLFYHRGLRPAGPPSPSLAGTPTPLTLRRADQKARPTPQPAPATASSPAPLPAGRRAAGVHEIRDITVADRHLEASSRCRRTKTPRRLAARPPGGSYPGRSSSAACKSASSVARVAATAPGDWSSLGPIHRLFHRFAVHVHRVAHVVTPHVQERVGGGS